MRHFIRTFVKMVEDPIGFEQMKKDAPRECDRAVRLVKSRRVGIDLVRIEPARTHHTLSWGALPTRRGVGGLRLTGVGAFLFSARV
jgi:hypothetical protein